MEWTRAGDRGLFLDLDAVTSRELHEKAVFLRKTLAPAAVITGHSSLLLLFEGRAPEPPAVLEPLPSNLARSRPEIVIPLSFDESDSLDLPEVLERLRMSKRVFIDTLLATKLEVRFLGFLPGFAYLDGLPAEWNLPRRLTSRLRVP
ncbi:MAG TPA: carboxyltransferase domain-containing protein, partial [Thermoanaerobaculia bacterium]|nr:carboxyltransferase domain-containing protein [Thermoanaerobaculia bacterium]